MAEPLSWLKLGPRARTPTIPLATNPLECKATRDPQPCEPRRPGLSRMSTCTPPEIGLEPSTDEDVADLLIRDQDQVWYNPSLDQMVEALQVLLMTRSVLEPIPIQYNSYVLHLVEGFATAQENIRRAEAAHREAKQSLEHNLEQFRLATDDWLERESQYRAEVKRLEVLLSKCSRGGLEAVALARTNSIVDRSGSNGDGFLSRLNNLRKHHINDSLSPSTLLNTNQVYRAETQESQPWEDSRIKAEKSATQVPTPKILDNDNDFCISEKFRQQDAATKACTTSREGWVQRRCETLQPDLDDMKRCQDGLCNPFADITIVPAVSSERHRIHQGGQLSNKERVRGRVSMGFSGSQRSVHQEDTSGIPTISAPDSSNHAKGSGQANRVATARAAAPRHERDHSGFSFETGDDFDPWPDNSTEIEKALNASHSAHKGLEGVAIEAHRRYDDDTNVLTTGSALSKELWPPRENGSPSTKNLPGKRVRGCRGTVHRRHTTVGSSPSQSSHSLDSLLAASATEQDISQRQQAEMDARIAATFALANVLGTTNQQK
ncbi:hypothetical protein F5Y12DRAFT_113763 [Xylaria sp. FL1777]|nr:hypothetical protein F5Y12DRAFT_113763 [Xylaria sp. FL1777]